VSFFFWGWALLLTISRSIDSGILCFAFTISAGGCGLVYLRQDVYPTSLIFGRLIAFSFVFVTAIFVSAATKTPESLHLAYLLVSAVIWAAYGLIYYFESETLRNEVNDSATLSATPLITKAEFT
jgi:lipopolysaccharide export LptBFGC system permease protein LptF